MMYLAPLCVCASIITWPAILQRSERAMRRFSWALAWTAIVLLGACGFWRERPTPPWSPRFQAPPLPNSLAPTESAASFRGQLLFHEKDCESCHTINGLGGERGPNLSEVADRLTEQQMMIHILHGGKNMPAFGGILHPDQLKDVVAYLETRKSHEGSYVTQAP